MPKTQTTNKSAAELLIEENRENNTEFKYVRPTLAEVKTFGELCDELSVDKQDMSVGKAYEHFLAGAKYDELMPSEQETLNQQVSATRRVVDMLERVASGELDVTKEITTIKNYSAAAAALDELI